MDFKLAGFRFLKGLRFSSFAFTGGEWWKTGVYLDRYPGLRLLQPCPGLPSAAPTELWNGWQNLFCKTKWSGDSGPASL